MLHTYYLRRMGRIIIDLDPDEEDAFKRKARDKTYRETVLDALNIPYEPRKMGRPTGGIAFTHKYSVNDTGLTLDQLRKRLDAKAAEQRKSDADKLIKDALETQKNKDTQHDEYVKKIRARG